MFLYWMNDLYQCLQNKIPVNIKIQRKQLHKINILMNMLPQFNIIFFLYIYIATYIQ